MIDIETEKPYELNPAFLEDLGSALCQVDDYLAETFVECDEGKKIETTWLYEQLPPTGRQQMNGKLCRDFIVTLHTLALKALSSIPSTISSRAEELLLAWVVNELKAFRVAQAEESDQDSEDIEEKTEEEIGDFLEAVTHDADYEFLYDQSKDGIEHMEEMHTGSMRVKDWFLPFRPDAVTNPLTWPEDKKFDFKRWKGFSYPET